MLKAALAAHVLDALAAAAAAGDWPAVPPAEVRFERPVDPSHGDLSTNVALHLARGFGLPPLTLAKAIAERLRGAPAIAAAEAAAPGFVNLRVADAALEAALLSILQAGPPEIARVASLPDWWLNSRESLDDPAYRLQRSHVMMGVVLRAAAEQGLEPSTSADLTPLRGDEAHALLLDIALAEDAIADGAPAQLQRLALRIAAGFDAFYMTGRVFGVERELALARLLLIAGARRALDGLVAPLGIALPEELA